MKYSLSLPVDEVDPPSEYCTWEALREMAQTAEAAGFDAVHVTEHPFPTQVGREMGGHHAPEPIVCMSLVAAATTRLRLHFHALVLPYRNPFLSARAVATLDAASGGRVIASVVPGYMAGEFAALGVPYEDRNKLMDEALVAMKVAWTGERVTMDSPRWNASDNVMLPKPVQRPHPPLWIGGNSRAAIRRAARHGQGWGPFPVNPKEGTAVRTASMRSIDDLRDRIAILREERAAAGQSGPFDICMTPFTHQHHPRGSENYDPPALLDEAAQLAEIGVTWLSVKARSPDRKTLLRNIERFGKEVLNR